MANKTRQYVLQFTWKEDGNRAERLEHQVAATTVQRAISKLVADINTGKCEVDIPASIDDEDDIRASDLLVIDVRTETK